MVSADKAKKVLLALEGVAPGRSYGLPAYLLAGKFFARFRDGDTVLVLQLGSMEDREVLLRLDPDAFFFTEHYRDYPSVLIRLDDVAPGLLAGVVAEAWRAVRGQRMPKPAKRGRRARRKTR